MAEGSNSYSSTTEESTSVATEVMTLWSKQRRMQDFYDYSGTRYVALGKQTEWSDDTDASINDQNPPIPSINTTDVTEVIGLQRISWQKFAKPVVNPTTEQKEDWNNYIYYKGLYYEVTSDRDYAIFNGFTCIMMYMLADRDNAFPVGVSFRQIGLYIGCNVNEYYYSGEDWFKLATEDRGNLDLVSNRMPLTRQETQSEEFFILLSF